MFKTAVTTILFLNRKKLVFVFSNHAQDLARGNGLEHRAAIRSKKDGFATRNLFVRS
jgi:hypothetical protein